MGLVEFVLKPESAAVVGAIAGVFSGLGSSLVFHRVVGRRGTFSYTSRTQEIAVSRDHEVFGRIAVTWNGGPVENLYGCTIEVLNESFNDYSDIAVSVYTTTEARILSEATRVAADAINAVDWTDHYRGLVAVPAGQQPTDVQRNIYNKQREYRVPTMNRGQTLALNFLLTAAPGHKPLMWAAMTVRGIRLKQRKPRQLFMGVPSALADVNGALFCACAAAGLAYWVANPWIAVYVGLFMGFVVKIPGVFIVRGYQKLREIFGG